MLIRHPVGVSQAPIGCNAGNTRHVECGCYYITFPLYLCLSSLPRVRVGLFHGDIKLHSRGVWILLPEEAVDSFFTLPNTWIAFYILYGGKSEKMEKESIANLRPFQFIWPHRLPLVGSVTSSIRPDFPAEVIFHCHSLKLGSQEALLGLIGSASSYGISKPVDSSPSLTVSPDQSHPLRNMRSISSHFQFNNLFFGYYQKCKGGGGIGI